MADNHQFSTGLNHGSFDDEELNILPLITKERTQKFELLLHLIPNLKQHLIVSGASGIGKTLLLDMLYDIDSEAWQCCFVQGSVELSFETIEAQLTKIMSRNRYASLHQAFQDFQDQHKKIVLIVDDAGLLVSGLMTTLIDYALGQPALKLIFSLTPEARQNHRQTDKALDNCYLLEIPTLTKRQCAVFLRHLAAKPRTYGTLQTMDAKLLDKIYRETQGIPARLISHFAKFSREKQNDYTKWLWAFVGLIILAMAINQSVRYFKEKSENDVPILPVEKVEIVEKSPVVQAEKPSTESQPQTEQDIVIPEFQLDIEKSIVSAPTNPPAEMTALVDKKPETTPIVASEKVAEPIQSISEPVKVTPIVEPPLTESETVIVAPALPVVIEMVKPISSPVIAFPKIEPAAGMRIQALPEKSKIDITPILAPEIKAVKEIKIEPVKKVEIKPIEKPAEVKKPEPVKVEPIQKIEPKSTKEKIVINHQKIKNDTKENVAAIAPPVVGHYTLQLITLSSDAAITQFQKKHPALSKNFRVVKSGSAGQERFALMYGGFENTEQATKARRTLPAEFANAFPRKLKP
ncbi:MAG: AAA family ATPase [Methylococcaceae bacterium]